MSNVLRVAGRRMALDRNPLRRWPDRIRAWVGIAAVVLVAVMAPLTVRPVMDHVHRGAVREASEQAAHLHRLPAVTLRGARPVSWTVAASMPEQGAPTRPAVRVPARWQGPDGRQHQSMVSVDHAVRAGQTVPVWTDARGAMTTAPATAQQIGVRTAFSGVGAGLAVLALIGGTAWLVRRLLARRSAAEWGREWLVVAPQWTRKY